MNCRVLDTQLPAVAAMAYWPRPTSSNSVDALPARARFGIVPNRRQVPTCTPPGAPTSFANRRQGGAERTSVPSPSYKFNAIGLAARDRRRDGLRPHQARTPESSRRRRRSIEQQLEGCTGSRAPPTAVRRRRQDRANAAIVPSSLNPSSYGELSPFDNRLHDRGAPSGSML